MLSGIENEFMLYQKGTKLPLHTGHDFCVTATTGKFVCVEQLDLFLTFLTLFLNICYIPFNSVHYNLECGLAVITERFSPLKSELYNLIFQSLN